MSEKHSPSKANSSNKVLAFFQDILRYTKFFKLFIAAIIAIFVAVSFVITDDGFVGKYIREHLRMVFNNENYTEEKKLRQLYSSAEAVIGNWQYVRDLHSPLSKAARYVTEHSNDVYKELNTININALKLRQKASWYYMFIEMSVIMAAMKKDTSYLTFSDKHAQSLKEVINFGEKSVKDSKSIMDSGFTNKLIHYELNAAVLRYLYEEKSEKASTEVKKALKNFGGCDQLIIDGIHLDYMFEVTQCPKKG